IYRLDEKGIKEITVDEDEKTVEQSSNSSDMVENKPVLLEKIPTRVEEKIVLFDPPEIDYIESIQGKTYLYINNESYYCMFTLTELEERLVPFGFFRSHRSYIVNLQQVREVISWTRNSYSLVLDNKQKTTIP